MKGFGQIAGFLLLGIVVACGSDERASRDEYERLTSLARCVIEHEFSPAFADSIAVARSEPVLPHALDEVSADLRRVEEALLAAASNLDEVQPPTPSLDEAHAELITGLREFASAVNEAASAATDDSQRLEGRLLELEPPERLIAAAERLERDGYRVRPLGERPNPARCR